MMLTPLQTYEHGKWRHVTVGYTDFCLGIPFSEFTESEIPEIYEETMIVFSCAVFYIMLDHNASAA